MHLIKALRRVIGLEMDLHLKNSGNIKNLLRTVDENVAVTFADVYYAKKAREKEVFEKGINLGHTFKNKNSFYRVELGLHVLFFVGTEAEILDNIQTKIEELKAKEEQLKKPIMEI